MQEYYLWFSNSLRVNGRVHDSALEEEHASEGVSDHEDEGMVHIEGLLPWWHRPQHDNHSSGCSGLTSLLIDLHKNFLQNFGDKKVPAAVDP